MITLRLAGYYNVGGLRGLRGRRDFAGLSGHVPYLSVRSYPQAIVPASHVSARGVAAAWVPAMRAVAAMRIAENLAILKFGERG